jgi:hypothetical protein
VDLGHFRKLFLREFAAEADLSDLLSRPTVSD